VPIIQGGANAVMNTYNQNQPQLQALQSQLTGSIIPGIQRSIDQTGKNLQPGYGYIDSTLGGKYLNSNPYTQAMAQFAGQQAGNAVNSAFSSAGRTGSGNHATDLARGVDQAANQVLFQNYQNEAASLLPGYTSAQMAGYTPLLGATQLAGQLPYYGSSSLGTIGSLLGGYGKTTGTQPGGWGTDLLSAGAMALPFIPGFGLSDRRTKKNIRKVGEAKDGLGIYEFVFKFDPDETVNRGVMADEVEKLRPWAFVPNYLGEYAGVNYAALGSLA
jgi:hypothetical protein